MVVPLLNGGTLKPNFLLVDWRTMPGDFLLLLLAFISFLFNECCLENIWHLHLTMDVMIPPILMQLLNKPYWCRWYLHLCIK